MQKYADLIQQLKDQKEELGLTQEQIAVKMKVERVRVSELFSSKKTNMTVKTLINLCNALKVTIQLTQKAEKKNKS